MVLALGGKGWPGGNGLKEAKMQHCKINNLAERGLFSQQRNFGNFLSSGAVAAVKNYKQVHKNFRKYLECKCLFSIMLQHPKK